MTRCPTCGCFHEPDEPHKVYTGPMRDRWTTGLAKEISVHYAADGMLERAADAVEALVHAARAIVDDYQYDTRCGCGKCSDCKLVLAVEAAEEWGDR